MDRGAWWATVHGVVAKSRTWLKWLSTHTCRIKDTDEWPVEEVRRVKSGRVLSTASVLESECITFLVSGFTSLESFWTPCDCDFWRFPHLGMSNHYLHFQSSFLKRTGARLKIPDSLFFVVTSSHPGAHPESPPWNKTHSYWPGNSKCFRSPVSGTGVKDQIWEQKLLLILLSLRISQRL